MQTAVISGPSSVAFFASQRSTYDDDFHVRQKMVGQRLQRFHFMTTQMLRSVVWAALCETVPSNLSESKLSRKIGTMICRQGFCGMNKVPVHSDPATQVKEELYRQPAGTFDSLLPNGVRKPTGPSF